jgi:hypothetical protein
LTCKSPILKFDVTYVSDIKSPQLEEEQDESSEATADANVDAAVEGLTAADNSAAAAANEERDDSINNEDDATSDREDVDKPSKRKG